MTREDVENNVGYWQEKANLEYIRQRQEHGVNDPYMITEINEAFDAGYDKGYQYALQHQWIPVEETNQLPPKIEGEEITEYYWVAGLYGRWYDVLRYDYRDGRWSDHYGNYHACVTHWMPIVPPRKEE